MWKNVPCSLLVVVSLCSATCGGNWPHWRGPAGNGAAENASPPVQWSGTKNVKWKVKLPRRENSSPVIWEKQVFVSSAAPSARKNSGAAGTLEFKIFCYDRTNGKLLWQKTAVRAKPHQKTHATNGFASASPCTDGTHVYAHFGSRGLYCYTMAGELKWKRDDFGQMDILNGFGEGSSPTLAGNLILVPWDHQGPSALYALDKATGETIWKVARDEPSGWATPLVVEHAGRKQVIMNGQNYARAYDLENGNELWRCGGQTVRPVTSPVARDGMVIIGSGFQGAFIGAFRLDGQGDIQGTDKVLWTIRQDAPDISSFLLSSGRLYFHKGKSGLLSCVDAATGKPHYMARRIEGFGNTYASPIAAGGHVYLTSTDGVTVVIDDADDLKIIATNSVHEIVGATPAPADDELFIRGEKHLFCIAASP
jgi:outer membrane protein assembly factor BamB